MANRLTDLKLEQNCEDWVNDLKQFNMDNKDILNELNELRLHSHKSKAEKDNLVELIKGIEKILQNPELGNEKRLHEEYIGLIKLNLITKIEEHAAFNAQFQDKVAVVKNLAKPMIEKYPELNTSAIFEIDN